MHNATACLRSLNGRFVRLGGRCKHRQALLGQSLALAAAWAGRLRGNLLWLRFGFSLTLSAH